MDIKAFQSVLERALSAKMRVAKSRDDAVQRRVDAWYDLKIGHKSWPLAIEQKSSPGPAPAQIKAHQRALQSAFPDVIPILAVPRLSRRERKVLRTAGVNFVDLSGNIAIRSEDLVAAIEGADVSWKDTHRKSRRNPFSKKASMVARTLLEHPSRPWGVREISDEGSISVGYTSEVLQTLVKDGYVAEAAEGFRLSDPVSLLKDWSAAYRWEDNEIHSYVAAFGKHELTVGTFHALRSAGARCLLTLLSAVDREFSFVEHDQVHIYVDKFSNAAKNSIRSRLHAEPVARGGNLHIMRPYYGDAVWYGSVGVNEIGSVSDIQLFLDLIHYPVRGAEAAELLLRKRIAPRLGLNRDQVRSLREGVGL
ncbi:MAG: type IV toxin-antitoxin system AbiEi family antitoxin [Gemmatimonadota bacterium]|nr:type IV toxin-antitoxin system AbiEi family antitoxin [Gemmatimonadota bacterium]